MTLLGAFLAYITLSEINNKIGTVKIVSERLG